MATAIRRNKQNSSRFAAAAQNRYTDALRLADTINAIGQMIKVAGVLLAIVTFVSIVNSFKSAGIAIMLALLTFASFFVVGVIVAAQGQLLRATVDTAVNSSPFMSDGQKAMVMSFAKSGADMPDSDVPAFIGDAETSVRFSHAIANAASGDQADVDGADEPAPSPFCYHCGGEVAADATICAACGKRL